MNELSIIKKYGVGLTGNIATGKSFVAQILRSLNYYVADADLLARQVVFPGEAARDQIVDTFGREVLNSDGSLDRHKMRGLIFSDIQARKKLESIVHPAIHQRLEIDLRKQGLASNPRLWFYEAALIIESGRSQEFKEIWITNCPLSLQQKRLMERDKLSLEDAQRAIAAQWPFAKKSQHATRIIDTNQSEKNLLAQLQQYVSHLKSGE